MKKRCLLLAVMTVILLVSCVLTAHAEEQLPAEIRDNLSGVTITRSVYVEAGTNEKDWFVLGKTGNGTNTLYCYRLKDGKWAKNFSTSKAVPQGKNRVDIYITATYQDYTTDKKYKGPVLVIDRMDKGDEYAELSVAYQHASSGVWNLLRISGYAEFDNMLIGDGYITFYRDMEDARVKGTVSGTFQRDLRYVNLSSFPKTYKEAQQKLTVAPTMPRNSDLTATDVKFTGGKSYEVYSAPDKTDIDFEFNSVRSSSEAERANLAKNIVDSVLAVFNSDVIDKPTAMEELRKSSSYTGLFTSITDEQIDAAKQELKMQAQQEQETPLPQHDQGNSANEDAPQGEQQPPQQAQPQQAQPQKSEPPAPPKPSQPPKPPQPKPAQQSQQQPPQKPAQNAPQQPPVKGGASVGQKPKKPAVGNPG